MMAASFASRASATLSSIATRSSVGRACSLRDALRAFCANSRPSDIVLQWRLFCTMHYLIPGRSVNRLRLFRRKAASVMQSQLQKDRKTSQGQLSHCSSSVIRGPTSSQTACQTGWPGAIPHTSTHAMACTRQQRASIRLSHNNNHHPHYTATQACTESACNTHQYEP